MVDNFEIEHKICQVLVRGVYSLKDTSGFHRLLGFAMFPVTLKLVTCVVLP